jgi:hypothetical protein
MAVLNRTFLANFAIFIHSDNFKNIISLVHNASVNRRANAISCLVYPQTWRMLNCSKHMEKLQPGMQNLCANFLGHLVQRGLFEGIR